MRPHYPPVSGMPLKAELPSIKPHFLRLPVPCKCAIQTVVTMEERTMNGKAKLTLIPSLTHVLTMVVTKGKNDKGP